MNQDRVFATGGSPEDDDIASGHRQINLSTENADQLLDEIDELLEDNAEEFVRSYVQKGGQ